MATYNLLISKFVSHSGEFYLIEEKSKESTQTYYALQLSNNYQKDYLQNEREKKDQFQKLRQFRHFLKMIEDRNKYYLFRYVQGNTIQQLIQMHRTQRQSISQETINTYVIEILEALFYLHQLNILGRIFSVENIIQYNGTLVLMDFGYGPDLIQNDLNILAPPEQIKDLVNQKQEASIINYSALKIDSWLLGAFLYHLVKLRPISYSENPNNPNKMQIYRYQDLFVYYNYIEEQRKKNVHINAETSRYNQNLIKLIHGLLTYDSQKRFSFLEIYQSDYVKSLNLQKQQQYIEFYTNFNEEEIVNNLMIRGGVSQSFILNTCILNVVIQQQGNNDDQKQSLQQNTLIQSSPLTVEKMNVTPQEGNPNVSEKNKVKLPYNASYIKDSKYKDIWNQINMEQFRFFILNDTADQIKSEYPQETYQLSLIIQYVLRKQSYLVLQDLFAKLKSFDYPWKEKQVNNWNHFQQENKFKFLQHSLIEAIDQLVNSMTQIQKELQKNSDEIKNFLNKQNMDSNLSIDDVDYIINENIYFCQNKCQNQLELFQVEQAQYNQEILLNSNVNLDSSVNKNQKNRDNQQKEWSERFNLFINNLFHFFEHFRYDSEYNKKYSKIILKILYCRLINKIFSLENINNNFKNIKCFENQIITPDDIYSYIESEGNYELKDKEILDLLCKYFQNTNNKG